MTECISEVTYDFDAQRHLVVKFSELDLSADAGILLAHQAEEKLQVCQRLSECVEEWRDPNKIEHSLHQLISQRVYQLLGCYEDANDSNSLRHNPIYNIACGHLPITAVQILNIFIHDLEGYFESLAEQGFQNNPFFRSGTNKWGLAPPKGVLTFQVVFISG